MDSDSGIVLEPGVPSDIEVCAINHDVDVLLEMTRDSAVIGDQNHRNMRFQVLDECADPGSTIYGRLRINADHVHAVGLHYFNCLTIIRRIYDLDSGSDQILPPLGGPRSIVIN